MSAFLEWLQSSLVVDVATSDSPKSDLPLVTTFTVSNQAKPQADNMPEVFFDEVLLTVGVPPHMHMEKHTNLAGGESFTYEHRCHYRDLGKVVYAIEGKISPDRLLRVGMTVKRTSPRIASISIDSYVEALKDLDIHRWLRGVIEVMPLPGSDPTGAEIRSQQDVLRDASKQILDTKSQLTSIAGFVARRTDEDKRNMSAHLLLIENYLGHTDQACGKLRTMLQTHNAKTIDATRNQLVNSLSQEAVKIDEASQRLLK